MDHLEKGGRGWLIGDVCGYGCGSVGMCVAQWEHVWLVQMGVIFSSEVCSLVRMGLAT